MTSESLTGKIALITGGTSGIGRQVALMMASQGALVVIVGRDVTKAQTIVQQAPERITFIQADLSEMKQVRRVAEEFNTTHQSLNYLIHSAGIYQNTRLLTSAGIEYNFAANYLNKFLLTNLLLPTLENSTPARVVVVGSPYVFNPLRFLSFTGLYRDRLPFPIWSQFKSGMAVSVWNVELARRLKNSNVTTNTVDPGIVRTDILRNAPWLVRAIHWMLRPLVSLSVEQGSSGPLYLATDDEVAHLSGQFYKNQNRGNPKPIEVPQGTYDIELGQRLWSFSEQLVSLDTTVPASTISV